MYIIVLMATPEQQTVNFEEELIRAGKYDQEARFYLARFGGISRTLAEKGDGLDEDLRKRLSRGAFEAWSWLADNSLIGEANKIKEHYIKGKPIVD